MPRRDEPHPMALAIAERIRQIRRERGLSLDRLAYESRVAKGHLSNVERGLVIATAETLQKIADGLGIEAFHLLVFPGKNTLHQCAEALRSRTQPELKQALKQLTSRRRRR